MNIVILSGRVATDIDSRVTKDGRLVSHFNIATPTGFKRNKDGKIPAEFHRINAWGKIAENCRDYLVKGRQINIRGHLINNTYTNKNGQKIRTEEVTADKVEFIDLPRSNSNNNKEPNENISSTAIPLDEAPTSVGVPTLQDMSIAADSFGIEIPF